MEGVSVFCPRLTFCPASGHTHECKSNEVTVCRILAGKKETGRLNTGVLAREFDRRWSPKSCWIFGEHRPSLPLFSAGLLQHGKWLPRHA